MANCQENNKKYEPTKFDSLLHSKHDNSKDSSKSKINVTSSNPNSTTLKSNQEFTSNDPYLRDSLVIIQKPINYNSKREKLSVEYLQQRHGLLNSSKPIIEPKMIVIHYTGIGNLNSIFNYFNRTELENSRALNKKQSSLNVSSQFLIDRNGDIYQLMDETKFARHTIGLNYCAIGIENIGSDKNPLTPEQLQSNVQLIKHLATKHNIEYVIGHSEYIAFRNSKLWKETNPNYITYKSDPGNSFMKKVREQLKEYNFKQKP